MRSTCRGRLCGFLLLAGALALFVACTGGGGDVAAPVSRIEIYLTDAPTDFDEVWVTMSDLEVHRSGGPWVGVPLTTSDADTNGDGVPDIIIDAEGVTANLLALRNVEALFASGQVDPGHYTGLRLRVIAARGVKGADTIPLVVPSGAQSGVKIHGQFTVDPGQLVSLVLDFDADKSIVERGGSGQPPILKPVIQVVPTVIVEATISTGADPRGVEYSPDGTTLAVANGGDSTVSIVDAATFQVLGSIGIGQGEASLEFTPDSGTLLAAAGGTPGAPGTTVWLIDVGSLSVASTVAVGPGPGEIGIRPDGDVAYVLNRGGSVPNDTVSVLDISDPTNGSVAATLTVGNLPHSVAFSDDGQRAVVTSVFGDSVYSFNAQTHAFIGDASGPAAPADVRFLAGSHVAAVANADVGRGIFFVDADNAAITPGDNGVGGNAFLFVHPSAPRIYALSTTRDYLRVIDSNDGSILGGAMLARGHSPDLDSGVAPPDPIHFAMGPTSFGGADYLALPAHGGELVLYGIGTSPGGVEGHVNLGDEIVDLDTNPTNGQAAVSVDGVVKIVNLINVPNIGLDLPTFGFLPPFPLTEIIIGGDTCLSGVHVLVDDGLGSAATSLVQDGGFSTGGQRIYFTLMGNIAQRFYGLADDIYDYMVVFVSSEFRGMNDPVDGNPIDVQPETGNAYHSWTRNYTTGIGNSWLPGNRFGNRAATIGLTTQRLQSRINMNDLAEVDGAFNAFGGRPYISIFAQELGHRFVAFAQVLAPEGPVRRNNAHWDHEFNSFGSAVGGSGGNLIADLGGGSFRVMAQESTYGPWDEYLLGFRDPAGVPGSFRIAAAAPAGPYNVGDMITGNRVNVSINDLITDNGPRIPDWTLAQRTFHVGVCLVNPDNSVRTADLTEVRTLLDAMADFWRDETNAAGYLTSGQCPTIYTTLVTDIPVGGSACDAAILPDGSKLYVTNLFDDNVSVIDTDPSSGSYHTVIGTVPVGDRPTAVGVRPDGNRVYVVNQNESFLSIIDPATDTPDGTIPTGNGGASIAIGMFGPGADRGYVLNAADDEIDVINLNTETVIDTIPTGNQGGFQDSDCELTRDGEVLVFTNRADDTVTAHGIVNGLETTLNSGGAEPIRVAIVQFESNPHNTVARAQASTSPPALVYVSNSSSNVIRVFDLTTDPSTNAFTFRRLPLNPDGAGAPFVPDIPTAADPLGTRFSPGGSVAIVPNRFADSFQIIETASHTVIETVGLGASSGPIEVVYSRNGRIAYVVQELADRVSAFR